MRRSVSPFSRASAVCMLMQLAQPLICEARIFTSSIRVGSRLAATAFETPIQFFMSWGAAAKRSSCGVMVRLLFVGSDDMTSGHWPVVTCACPNAKNILSVGDSSADLDHFKYLR